MKRSFSALSLLSLALAVSAVLVATAAAEDGNWKRGRVYFRMVCTECHKEMTGAPIPPNSRTIAEWTAYMEADKHDASGKSKPKVSDYTSTEYRQSIMETNKAAKSFMKVPDETLFMDVRAFVIHGAKDSDTPATCQ